VPPPKYTVDRLVPCKLGSTTTVEELFIIERGAPAIADLTFEDTVERMITNTDDAYGFPPFRYLAPAITVGGLGYAELRAKERHILQGFLANIRTRSVASDSFGWADEIPKLIRHAAVADPEPAAVREQDTFPNWRAATRLAPSGGAA
jgi:dolichol-phosphate mannosyltransferase